MKKKQNVGNPGEKILVCFQFPNKFKTCQFVNFDQFLIKKKLEAQNRENPFFRASRFFKNSRTERDNGIFRLNIWDWGFLRPLGIG